MLHNNAWIILRSLLGCIVSVAFILGLWSCDVLIPYTGKRMVNLDFTAAYVSPSADNRSMKKGVFTSSFDTITLDVAELDETGTAMSETSYSITPSEPSLAIELKPSSSYSLKLTTTMTQSYAIDALSTVFSHTGSWSQTLVILPNQEPRVNFKPARLTGAPQEIDLVANATQASSMVVSSSRADQTGIEYQILDTAVAVVDTSGTVTAVAPGTTWLIATPMDGGFSSFVPITVIGSYTVTYDGNGATSGAAPAAQAKLHNVPLFLAGNTGTLTKSGFSFAGWNTAPDGSGTAYGEGGTYTANSDETLYARWTNLATYTISYDANGATSGTAPINQTKIQGGSLTLATNSGSLALTGYTLASWNTQANGLGTSYALGAAYTNDAALTLFATWTIETYTIMYDANGATSGSPPASQVKTYNINSNFQTNSGVLARTGHTFGGWNTAANGAGTTYAEGALNTINSNLTLYAKWNIITYSVTYDGNGNDGGSPPSSQMKAYNIALTLSGAGSLTKSGNVFDGWNTQANGLGTNYAAGGSYTTNAAVTLYAKWVGLDWHAITSSSDGTKLAAIVRLGQIYTSTDYGLTWTARESNRDWRDITSDSTGQYLAAVVNNGLIYTSSNYGASWTARNSIRNWRSIASDSTGAKLAAVVNSGQIYTSTDYGVTWTARESTRNWFTIASSSDGTKLVAGALAGQLYTSTDSGLTWTARDSARNWDSVASSSDGTKLAAVIGNIYTSTDSGASWTPRGSVLDWTGITSDSSGTKLAAVANNGQIYTSTNSGVGWTARDSIRDWKDITSDSTGTNLAAIVLGGHIYTSTDSGVTWTLRF